MLTFVISVVLAAAGASSGTRVDPTVFESRIVALHDIERKAVGSPPIAWDDDLAREAAIWAAELARTGSFEHDPDNEVHGENLWMGTRGYYSLDDMVEGWSEEKALLKRLRSWDHDSHAVGHYTQMVWKDTTRVGCAMGRNRADEFLVCRYSPPGNVLGESPYASGGMSLPSGR